jgi:hypothetical protein
MLMAFDVSRAQSGARQDSTAKTQNNRYGTWSALTASGIPISGGWTAVLDSIGFTVTGTWTLIDEKGKTVAGGGWSAAKSPTTWTGAWRAVMTGRDGEYSGTWSTNVDLKGNARFEDLFDKAVQSIVSGMWKAGSNSGPWSIRAAPK